MESKLIILRGNSASGKTTIAKGLQSHLGSDTLVVSQDIVRRDMLKANDTAGNLSIDLIKKIAEYGNGRCQLVIVEGILVNKRYKKMLFELIESFNHSAYIYYFDLPFKETLIRHQTRAKVHDFGSKEMRSWWVEKDYLGTSNEKIITETLSKKEIIQTILDDIR